MKSTLAMLSGPLTRTTPFPIEEPQISEKDIDAVLGSLRAKRLSIFSSPSIAKFEAAFASYIGVRHAVALTSGTAALQTALASANIGSGNEVIVPVYTYASTINAIILQGATPIFVDINPKTFNLDSTNLSEVEQAITPKTRAIMIVDLFGIPVPRERFVELANIHNLTLIEDCAQSTGALSGGEKVGSFGVGCHSFGEIKNMTSAEGGMLTTNDAEVARRARLVRHSGECWRTSRTTTIGSSPDLLYEMIDGIDYEFVGANFRMNALQAALGLSQLRRLDDFNRARIEIAKQYSSSLANVHGVQLATVPDGVTAVFNRYPLVVSSWNYLSRNAFLAALISEGVPAGVYYPVPFNETTTIKKLNGDKKFHSVTFPSARNVCDTHILLPCYPGLTSQDVSSVIKAVMKVAQASGDRSTAEEVERKAINLRATYFGQFFSRI